MPDGRPEGLTDDEWAAITAHRKATQPQRRGTVRLTDPSGAEFEIELTPEEAAKKIAGLFTDDKPKDGKDDEKKPAQLKDFFGAKKAATS